MESRRKKSSRPLLELELAYSRLQQRFNIVSHTMFVFVFRRLGLVFDCKHHGCRKYCILKGVLCILRHLPRLARTSTCSE